MQQVKRRGGYSPEIKAWLATIPDMSEIRARRPYIQEMVHALTKAPYAIDVRNPNRRIGMLDLLDTPIGSLHFPRFEQFHRCLERFCPRKKENLVVVENGPGPLIHGSATLARIGVPHVYVKEPHELRRHLRRSIEKQAPEMSNRIHIVDDIDQPTPADIVYFVNPGPQFLVPADISLAAYLARDVKPGGLFVLQTDYEKDGPASYDFSLDPNHEFPGEWPEWGLVESFNLFDAPALPTLQYQETQYLHIYRRRIPPSFGSNLWDLRQKARRDDIAKF